METFEHDETIARPLDEVWAWHQRPGALTRLSPEWAQRVVSESWPPLADGARAQLRTSAPGTAGTVRVPFVSEHGPGPTEHSFVDRMVRGPLHSWTHTHTFSSAHGEEGTRILDRIDYEASPPGLPVPPRLEAAVMEPTLRATFDARTVRLRADLEFHRELREALGDRRLKVLIGGASGLVGSQVAALLSTGGHEVRRLVRREAGRADEVAWDPSTGALDPQAVAWADVVVHLGGASIARRLTRSAKRRIMDSRIESTRLIADVIRRLPEAERPEAFVCSSAIGWYGADRGSAVLDESAEAGEGFLAEVCTAWEAEAARVEALGVRRVSVRTGVVLTSLGGMLRVQLPLYLVGAGGPLGGGDAWLSWISLDDVARIVARAALDGSLSGPVNATAPHPVRQRDFARELGRALHRPAAVPAPALGPRLLLGREANDQLVMADQRVVPSALEAAGHVFRHARLSEALAETLPPTR